MPKVGDCQKKMGARTERRWREERGAGGAAVEKRMDKRKPAAFFGYRKRAVSAAA